MRELRKSCDRIYDCLKELTRSTDPNFFYAIARCYRKGLGVSRNMNLAIEYLEIAKKHRDVGNVWRKATWRLGNIYEYYSDDIVDNLSFEDKKKKAVEYYTEAVENEFHESLNDLARHYGHLGKTKGGFGVKKNVFKAFHLLEEAIKYGHPMAYRTKAELLSELKLFEEATESYECLLREIKKIPFNDDKKWRENRLRDKAICKKQTIICERKNIFISHSCKNDDIAKEVCKYLCAEIGAERVWCWEYDTPKGEHIHRHIQKALAETAIAVILLSADYLKSDVCVNYEWPYCLKLHERGKMELVILPIEECDSETRDEFGFSEYHLMTRPSEYLNSYNEQRKSEVYKDMLQKIRVALATK